VSAAAAVTLAVALPAGTLSAQIIPPAVPAGLEVPAGHQAFLVAHAEGTQNYTCLLSPGGFAWAFFGPQATLFGETGQQVMTHHLGANPDEGGALRPTWQHSIDSSAIWAAVVASSADPAFVAPGAIPWLLLRTTGHQPGSGGDTLAATTFIHRVNTAGGLAPATGCKAAHDVGRKALVPYTTDYVLYR
jgi:Protein of unknown function (DUF3455)